VLSIFRGDSQVKPTLELEAVDKLAWFGVAHKKNYNYFKSCRIKTNFI
jgi:hypothetical protein